MVLCNESKMILQFIEEIGGITTEQIKALFPKADNRARDYYINSIKGVHVKETSKGSGVYVNISGKEPFLKKNEIAGWVLLNNEVDMSVDSKEYFRAAHPAQIFFMAHGKVYTVVYIDENGEPIIQTMNELYFRNKRTADDGNMLLFVTTSEESRELVRNANINAPFCGAFVYRDNNGDIAIEYDLFDE